MSRQNSPNYIVTELMQEGSGPKLELHVALRAIVYAEYNAKDFN